MKRIFFAMMVLVGCCDVQAQSGPWVCGGAYTLSDWVPFAANNYCGTLCKANLMAFGVAGPDSGGGYYCQVKFTPVKNPCVGGNCTLITVPGVGGFNWGGQTTGLSTNASCPAGGTCISGNTTLMSSSAPWTPDLRFGGNNTGLVFASTGNYEVLGDYVIGDFEVSISNKGTSSGTITLGNIPFLADNTLAANSGGGPLNSYSGFTALPGVPWMYVDTSNVLHMVYGNATGFVSLSSSVLTNTSAFRGTFKYKIAQ